MISNISEGPFAPTPIAKTRFSDVRSCSIRSSITLNIDRAHGPPYSSMPRPMLFCIEPDTSSNIPVSDIFTWKKIRNP